MSQDVFKARWKHCRSELNLHWNGFSREDLDHIDGRRDKLVFLLESRYGFARRRAEREVERVLTEFEQRLERAS